MFSQPNASYEYLQVWWKSLDTGIYPKIGVIEQFNLPFFYNIKEDVLPCGKRVLGIIVSLKSLEINYFYSRKIYPLLSFEEQKAIFHPFYREGTWRIVEGWER